MIILFTYYYNFKISGFISMCCVVYYSIVSEVSFESNFIECFFFLVILV